VKIPSCHAPSGDTQYRLQLYSETTEATATTDATSYQTSPDFDVTVQDTKGIHHKGNSSCDECIEVNMSFVWPSNLEAPSTSKWTAEENSGYDIRCECWNGSEWSTDCANQAKTTVNFDQKTIQCCATSTGTFSSSVQKIQTPTIEPPVTPAASSKNDDDSDESSYWKEFNPFYLSIVLYVIMVGLIASAFVVRRSKVDGEELVSSRVGSKNASTDRKLPS
jgi:hypothetical protein